MISAPYCALLAVFLIFIRSDCAETLSPGLGVHQFRFSTSDNDRICINFTIAPFTFVVNEFGEDTLYREYTYDLDGSVTFTEIAMRFLPVYRYIENEFHSIEIRTISETTLSFMTVVLPGMCHDGLYISTVDIGEITMSKNSHDFYNLSIYDDKCFVFGPADSMDLDMEMQSSDYEDQLYIHYSYSDFVSISGNDSASLLNYSARDPAFLRLVADENAPPDTVFISYSMVGPRGRNPRQDIRSPANALQVCDRADAWFDGSLVVAVVTITLGLSLAFLVWVCVFTIRQTRLERDEESPEAFSSVQWGTYTARD
jgi:hypothetical protein